MTTSGRIRILMRCAGAAMALLLLCSASPADAQTRRRTGTNPEVSPPAARVQVRKMTRRERMLSGQETHHKIRGTPLIQTQELFTLGDDSGRSDQFYKQSKRLFPNLFK